VTAYKPLMISRLILIGLLIAACGPDTATYIVQSKPVGRPTVAYYANGAPMAGGTSSFAPASISVCREFPPPGVPTQRPGYGPQTDT
jgi:hypothetical protein